jgi:hypothetical protein
MPADYIDQLPAIGSIKGDDILIIQQRVGAQETTYHTTVEQLLGAFVPMPAITNTAWDIEAKQLTIEGENLLPTSLITVDNKHYKIDTYEHLFLGGDDDTGEGESNNQRVIIIMNQGLSDGSHTIVVKNCFVKVDTHVFVLGTLL